MKYENNMKKFTLCLLALVTGASVWAENVKLNGLYYSLGSTTATVISDQSSDKSVYKDYPSVTIPASVTFNNYTYPVTGIGTSAFESCSNLQSVSLPSSINTINTDAFYGCVKLGSVILPEGLTTIGLRAFWGCNLTEVTIPSTVTSIGNSAFNGNPLTTIVWKPATCSIGSDGSAPFYSTDSKVTSFTFAEGVETVPAYICKNMNLLDTIVLPSSVKSLGQCAFMYCSNLKSINLPVTQKTLPVSFFEGCTSLESIELPATLTTIRTDAFYGCTKLAKVNLHEGITTIEQRAFYNCKLDSIVIPSTVTSIGNGAFKGNPTTSIVWKPKSCSIGSDDSAPFYSTDSKVTSFTFGEGVEVIPAYLCENMNLLDTIVLPSTVTTIGAYSFKNCSALKGIQLPEGAIYMGDGAFMSCTSLKSFAFPEGKKSLPTSVLEGCTALEEVFIPSSVTTINQDAFYNCSSLRAIHNLAFTPQSITERAVNNVNKKTCILYVPIDYIDLYRAKAVWCDFINIIGVATDLQFDEELVQVNYLTADSSLYYMEAQKWEVPHAPRIEGFTFLRWDILPGTLKEGIKLQAVYEANAPTSAPADIVVNPSNPAQKLIRNGNVYILRDDRMYNINGATIR